MKDDYHCLRSSLAIEEAGQRQRQRLRRHRLPALRRRPRRLRGRQVHRHGCVSLFSC